MGISADIALYFPEPADTIKDAEGSLYNDVEMQRTSKAVINTILVAVKDNIPINMQTSCVAYMTA